MTPGRQDAYVIEVTALRNRIADLEMENKELRGLLTPKLVFPSEWLMESTDHRVLSFLYEARGGVRSIGAIYYSTQMHGNADCGGLVRVHIHRLRKKLAQAGQRIEILTVPGIGYRLAHESVHRLDSVVAGLSVPEFSKEKPVQGDDDHEGISKCSLCPGALAFGS